jgi:predicted N-acetyltransferase YhbS
VIVREAQPGDAEQLIGLMEMLGHGMESPEVRRGIEELGANDLPQLVAVEDGKVVGLCGLHRMTAIHRSQPVGRVTILIVATESRGKGVGRQLMSAAEDRLRAAGCGMIEVTSNNRLVAAHEFYEHLGYDSTSKRFAKKLN